MPTEMMTETEQAYQQVAKGRSDDCLLLEQSWQHGNDDDDDDDDDYGDNDDSCSISSSSLLVPSPRPRPLGRDRIDRRVPPCHVVQRSCVGRSRDPDLSQNWRELASF